MNLISVDSLIPNLRNTRTHSPEQVNKIAASITEFGWTNPVLIDGNNGIIAGHGRIMAAKKLGITEVPAINLAHLSEVQRRAYIIADNRLALDAGWDEGLLAEELAALKMFEFDLNLLSFDADEITEIEAKAKPVLPEKIEELKNIKYTRILISIPVNKNIDIKNYVDELLEQGAEIDYGGN